MGKTNFKSNNAIEVDNWFITKHYKNELHLHFDDNQTRILTAYNYFNNQYYVSDGSTLYRLGTEKKNPRNRVLYPATFRRYLMNIQLV